MPVVAPSLVLNKEDVTPSKKLSLSNLNPPSIGPAVQPVTVAAPAP